MSYDIDLEAAACAACGVTPNAPYCPDPTYNLARIFHLALTGDRVPESTAGTLADVVLGGHREREAFGLELLTGKTGAESLAMLDAAIERLADERMRGAFVALEPDNKWGTVDDGLIVIRKLRELAAEHFKHTWRVR